MEPTEERVRQIAAWLRPRARVRVVQRGIQYYRAGAVETVQCADGHIVGLVKGTKHYETSVFVPHRGQLGGVMCTCPYTWSDVCEHAVALLLANADYVLTRQEGLEGDGLRLGAARERVVEWARNRGVEAFLHAGPTELKLPHVEPPRHLPFHVRAGPSKNTLLEVVAGETGEHFDNTLRVHALCILWELAAARGDAGDQGAAARPPVPRPDDEVLAAAWQRLAALQADVARKPPPPLESLGTLPRVTVRERRPIVEVQGWCVGGGKARATVHLGSDDEPARVQCTCEDAPGEWCTLRHVAMRAAWDLLGAEPSDPSRQRLYDALATPAWRHALDALTEALAPAAGERPDEQGELGWLLEEVSASFSPIPWHVRSVWARLRRDKKGWTARGLSEAQLEAYLPLATPHDVRVARALAVARGVRGGYVPSWDKVAHVTAWVRVFEELVGHPFVLWRPARGTPVQRVTVEKCRASLLVERHDDTTLHAVVRLGERTLSPAQAHALLAPAWAGDCAVVVDAPTRTFFVVEADSALMEAIEKMAELSDTFPLEAVETWVRFAVDAPPTVSIELGEGIGVARLRGAPRAVLFAELDPGDALRLELLVRPHPGLDPCEPGAPPHIVPVVGDQGVSIVERDVDAEQRCVEEAAMAVGWPDSGPQSLDDALDIIGAAVNHDEVEVLWRGSRRVALAPASLEHLSLEVDHRRDWFGLRGGVDTAQGAVPLGALLAAIRAKHEYIRLGPTTWARIDARLRERLAGIAALTDEEGEDSVTVSALLAPVIGELADDIAQFTAPPVWHDLVARAREAADHRPDPPAGLQATLRPYQLEGYQWLSRMARWAPGACLADDMGLGKTVQALALLLERAGEGPALVVAPTSLGFNWEREAAQFAPGLRVLRVRGKADVHTLDDPGPGDLVVTSYTVLARHVDRFAEMSWATLVLDEAQAIKNASTRRARAVFRLEASFRLALTGTPVENRVAELWSLFRAIAPGLLGSRQRFRERFERPIDAHGDVQTRAALARIVRPFVLRRLKQEVASDLPPRTEVRLDVELSAAERRLYEQVRRAAVAALAGLDPTTPPQERRFQVLAALTRLRQLACHPRLCHPDTTVASSKLAVLLDLVRQVVDEGHAVLVFSQFTSLLALVREALEREGIAHLYLDGSTPQRQRAARVDAFQRGQAPVFLLSLKAAGTGLNLTAADYVVHLDPWWNPAVEAQAADRVHRIGQQRAVTIYRLVARDTVEDEIMALQDTKRELVEALLAGTGKAAALDLDTLVNLLRGGAAMLAHREAATPPSPTPAAASPGA